MKDLFKIIRNKNLILGAAVGSGMTAKMVEEGGANFILALSAGRFRTMGFPSILSLMPVYKNNDEVLQFAAVEMLKNIKIPIFVGLSAFDPQLNLEKLIGKVKEVGFAGVVNFPTCIHLDGKCRQVLESCGFGFDREIQILRSAKEAGLATLAYVKSEEEARESKFADILCLNFGWNSGGKFGIKSQFTKEQAKNRVLRLKKIFAEECLSDEKPIFLVEGGAIKNMQEAVEFCEESDLQGYVGGSTIDRIPLEETLIETTVSFGNYYKIKREYSKLSKNILGEGHKYGIYGSSPAIIQLIQTIRLFAEKNVPVLVTGENGTGKELVARALHLSGDRADKNFCAINCAAIPKDLLESELFGHVKGAFTGAVSDKIGKFQAAHHGVIFLDEIGEMPPQTQSKLLRFLEDKCIQPIGSNKTIQLDIRIICATNRNLKKMIKTGGFREDIFYRLNTLEISLPPLRERIEDIFVICRFALEEINIRHDLNVKGISDEVFKMLLNYDWPGNVRQLKNVLEHSAILCENESIEKFNLPKNFLNSYFSFDKSLQEDKKNISGKIENDLEKIEKQWIVDALKKHRFKRGETAKALKLSEKTLYNKMKHYRLI